jgi:hypothetical protein
MRVPIYAFIYYVQVEGIYCPRTEDAVKTYKAEHGEVCVHTHTYLWAFA